MHDVALGQDGEFGAQEGRDGRCERDEVGEGEEGGREEGLALRAGPSQQRPPAEDEEMERTSVQDQDPTSQAQVATVGTSSSATLAAATPSSSDPGRVTSAPPFHLRTPSVTTLYAPMTSHASRQATGGRLLRTRRSAAKASAHAA